MSEADCTPGSRPEDGESCMSRQWLRRRPALGYLLNLQERQAVATAWDWEATLERSYCRLLAPGARVVDVGGHHGRHTQAFLEHARCTQVWVFEPLPDKFAHLQQCYGEDSRVRLHNMAVSDRPGHARFTVNMHSPEESGLRRRQYNDEAHAKIMEIDVNVTTLDAQDDLSGIGFVKIDVEGAELDVLAGASALARRDRPLFSVEFGRPAYGAYARAARELFDLAESWGYRLTDLLGHPFDDLDEWLRCVDRYYWDYLLIPHERWASSFGQLLADPWPVPAIQSRPTANNG